MKHSDMQIRHGFLIFSPSGTEWVTVPARTIRKSKIKMGHILNFRKVRFGSQILISKKLRMHGIILNEKKNKKNSRGWKFEI